MKQREAVIETLERLWWIATLWEINHNVFDIKDCERKTKTPFASIRRIVQTTNEIYKIKPWLYWLVKMKKENENRWFFESTKSNDTDSDFTHYYYQWLLVEIWNIKQYQTYVPQQDQNKKFLNHKLSDIATVHHMYDFGYESLIRRAKTIDVIRFNNRNMPNSFYEIEHSTDIQNSLLKFVELQDFYAEFVIVANKIREREFKQKINQVAFDIIRNRVKFMSYDFLSNYHTKTYEFFTLERQFFY